MVSRHINSCWCTQCRIYIRHGALKGSNTSKLHEELAWESLTDRRWYRRILHFYKTFKDLTPSYLKDIIPPLRRSLYDHQREVFHKFRCHSFSLIHSFIPDSIKSWNNIVSEFTWLSPVSKFNEALFSFFRPAKNSVFGIQNPTGVKKLFQLRLGFSQLKSHKKPKRLLIHPPISVFATMRLKIQDISFADALFFLFKGVCDGL